jgi:hypothetical protein
MAVPALPRRPILARRPILPHRPILPRRLAEWPAAAVPRWSVRLRTRALYAGFSDILLSGTLRGPDPAASCLVVANHLCGWDLQVAHFLTCREQLRFCCFTNPTDLERQPGLAHLGLRPIPRDDPMAAATALREEGRRLNRESGAALWVFPQGGYARPAPRMPVETGALGVRAYAPRATFTAVALHYEMLGPRRSWAWARATQVPAPGPRNATGLRDLLAANHEALLGDLANGTGTYRPVLRRRSQVLVLDGVPVDLAILNGYLQLEEATAGSRLVPGGPGQNQGARARRVRLNGPASRAELAACLSRNIGRSATDLVLDRLDWSGNVDEHLGPEEPAAHPHLP